MDKVRCEKTLTNHIFPVIVLYVRIRFFSVKYRKVMTGKIAERLRELNNTRMRGTGNKKLFKVNRDF